MRVLGQNRGVSEVRSARDKLIVILESLEYFREQVSPSEQMDLMNLSRMCFRELSVSMAILERAFVDSLDGNKLHKVLKELILRIDTALMEVKKKNIDLISFGSDDMKRDVNVFYREFVNGRHFSDIDDSEDKGEWTGNDGMQKRMVDLQMQLASKNQIIENYAEELDRLNNRIGQMGGGDGSNCRHKLTAVDINAIYTDIENLNKTIDHLKKENQKLRQSLNQLGSGQEKYREESGTGKGNQVDNLTDKLQSLEKRIKAGPPDVLSGEHAKTRQQVRIAELEGELHRLTRQIVDFEEGAKNFSRERESLENNNTRIKENLDKLIEDHDTLKNRSLDLLKSNTHIENENDVLRKEKTQLVDNILGLQKSHQEELNSLRSTLESITEKLYVVGLDTENKQTFAEMEQKHTNEKKALTERNRVLQETCEQLERDSQSMDEKIGEQHQIITTYQKVEGTLREEQRKLRNLESEFDKLNDNFTNLEGERDEALHQIKSLERELNQTRGDKAQARDLVDALTSQKSNLDKINNDLDLKIQDLERTVIDLKDRLKQAEQQTRSQERTISQ
jgi:chromosome segregation ATPase